MPRGHATLTYDDVTPESAEDGDVAASGFASPGGWTHEEPERMPIGEALRWAQEQGYCEADRMPFHADGRRSASFYFYEPDQDRAYFEDGRERTYALHIHDVTPSTLRRIARVLGVRIRG